MTTSPSMQNIEASSRPLIRVAVGVIRDHAGRVLIALRAPHQHQGDLWEFPGGKIEAGETCRDALIRELKEELGIDVLDVQPLIQIEHHYSDKSVLLEVCQVIDFSGDAVGREGQPLKWVLPKDLYSYRFPSANKPIIRAVNLPERCVINGEVNSEQEFAHGFASSVDRGAQMLLLRLKGKPFEQWQSYIKWVQTQAPDLPMVVSSKVGEAHWLDMPGLHLTSEHLLSQTSRPIAHSVLLGASCHDENQIRQADSIGVDYITLSQVLPTSSHPLAEPLGWEGFKSLVRLARCPVYALGGMSEAHFAQVRLSGGHGIAAMGHYWR